MKCLFFLIIAMSLLSTAGNAKEITFSEGTNFGLSASPSGKTIALDLQGILWILPSSGGVAVPITSGQQPEVREPSYAPDGKTIAFQGFFENYFHIWVIDEDGKNLRQITSGKYDDREPSWNASGDSIVFSSDRSGNYDIWEISLDTGKETQLTFHPDDDAHPHKSSDGRRLLHTREIKGRYSEVIVNDGGREVTLFKSDTTVFYRPSWNPNNNGFSLIANRGNSIELRYVEAAENEPGDITDFSTQRDPIVLDKGDLFPFRASWTRNNGVFYTGDGAIKYLGTVGGIPQTINFTATISSIQTSYPRKPMAVANPHSQQVLGIGSLDISPQDNRLIYTALGGMWLQDHSLSDPRQLSEEIGHVVDPAWSPDGSHIAFVAERQGQMDIWIRNMETGTDRQLTRDPGREYRVSWSPKGDSLAYLSARSITNTWGRVNLKTVDTKNGSINTVDKSLFTPGRPVWSPDGENILLAHVKPASSRFREGLHGIKRYGLKTSTSDFMDLPNDIGLSTRDGSGPVISPNGLKMAYISEGEVRTVGINSDGGITGILKNRCRETAQMPRWGRDSTAIYYFSGKDFNSCNVETGEKHSHKINLRWAKSLAKSKTLHVGRLFDGVGKKYKTNVDLFISGDKITKIVPHGQDPVQGRVYDFSDKVVMPGLIASHSHQSELVGERLGRNWLSYGITSVRDPGGNPYKSLMRKETWESGKSIGPRLFYAGWLTGGARVYYGQSFSAVNEKALMHELERAQELKYDLLKSYVRLPDEFQQILVQFGHRLGIPVTGHEISPAVQNGVDSVEHMGATSRRGYSPKFSSLSKSYDDVMAIISDSGLMITPTATLMSGYSVYASRYPEYLNQARSKTFLDEMQRQQLAQIIQSRRAKLQPTRNKSVLKSIKSLHDRGANLTAGTDSPFIPYGLAQIFELIMFVDAGLTPYDAIRTSTVNAAKLLGVEDVLGTLESGKLADMVVLEGDPLANITDLFNVHATVKDGHVFSREEMLVDRSQ